VTSCVVVNPVPAITYYSRANGDWNVASTWSTVSHTSTVNTGTYPQNNDVANMNHKVAVPLGFSGNCGSATVYTAASSSNSQLTVDGTLNVNGNLAVRTI